MRRAERPLVLREHRDAGSLPDHSRHRQAGAAHHAPPAARRSERVQLVRELERNSQRLDKQQRETDAARSEAEFVKAAVRPHTCARPFAARSAHHRRAWHVQRREDANARRAERAAAEEKDEAYRTEVEFGLADRAPL